MDTNRWVLVVELLLAPGGYAAAEDDAQVHEIKAGTMNVHVDLWGLLEATRSDDVYSLVEGQATIISIVPEGTRVTKGQIVCELDSSWLNVFLSNQVFAIQGADAAYQNARLTREVAEIAVIEYKQGIYVQQRETLAGEAASCQSEIPMAEARRDRLQSALVVLRKLLAANGGAARTAAEIVAEVDLEDRLKAALKVLGEARAAIEQVRIRQEILEKYTAPKTLKELAAKVEKARSDELSRQATWDLEKTKEAKLRRQIQNCKLLALNDGLVVYANDRNKLGGISPPQIEEGATVRERQKVFSIPDTRSPLRVNIKVPETVVEWIRPGQRARVKVEGVEGDFLPGSVEAISLLPDPTAFLGAKGQARAYTTYVRIEKSRPGVALGMTAEVEIVTDPLDGVLTLPLSSAVYYDGTDHVAVKKAGGGWEWLGVSLGLSDGSQAEVKAGLKNGQAVALDPAPFLSGGQKLRISLSPPKPAPMPRPAARRQ